MSSPRPIARAAAQGRPATDPGCAGCAHLVTLRALRRAGVEVQGGIGCEEAAGHAFTPAHGRWGAMTGVARLLREGAPALLADATRAGAGLVVVADRIAPVRSLRIEEELARAGARYAWLELDDAGVAEAQVREALDRPGTVLVALARCVRGMPRAAPLVVDPVALQSLRLLPHAGLPGALSTAARPPWSTPTSARAAVDARRCAAPAPSGRPGRCSLPRPCPAPHRSATPPSPTAPRS